MFFFERVFSKYQCGLRKGHSAQQCLLTMTEKWGKKRLKKLKRLFESSETKEQLDKYTTWRTTRLHIGSTTF